MNWKQQIFKPKWQHRDAEVRRDAVATGQEPELLDALGDLCLADEDAAVRAAAARRLTDLPALNTALGREPDKAVLQVVAERVRQLTASASEERPPLEARLEIVARSTDRELLEAVAASAPEADLRMAALRKVDRQGFLGDRAISDPDPEIRSTAAAAISQHSTLRRVIEGTRTTDKALHQALAERLHRELLAAGDRGAIDKEALAVCTAVEHAALKPGGAGDARLAEFLARWKTLGGRARPEHQARFERDLARLAGEPVGADAPADDAEFPEAAPETPVEPGGTAKDTPDTAGDAPVAPGVDTADADKSEPASDEGPPSAILAEATQVLRDYLKLPSTKLVAGKVASLERTWKSAWTTLSEPNAAEHGLRTEAAELLQKLSDKLAGAARRRDDMLEQATALVEELRGDLEDGELHKALEVRAKIQKIGKQLGKEPRWRKLSAQVNDMQGRLRELRGWQHWSNNRIRKEMIKEMEALPLADLHPDAVLDRIKELQARWKELEQSEQIPGDKHFAAAPWMWRKFNAAGRKAFETTKPFLDKRSEIQKKHLESMRAIGKRITELAGADEPDWTELARAMRAGRSEMRSLGEVPARQRHKMAQRLKAALEKGNAAMQAHYEVVEKHKLKLIREAAQLAHVADRTEAINRAKALQAEWKAAGALWRSRENKLWREFRASLDPLFADLKAEQQSHRERQEALLSEQKSLCAGLDEILKLDDDALPGHQGKVQGLQDDWKDIRHPDRRLQQSFNRALARYEERVAAHERRAERRVREAWWDKAEVLHKAEGKLAEGKLTKAMVTRLRKAWPDTPGDEELDRSLGERLETALAETPPEPSETGPATLDAARKLCICLEFLAGLPSPEDEKDLRMQYQVDRLSESLSGERTRMSAVDEARLLEAEWLGLPFIPDPEHASFKSRIQAALDAISQG